MKRQHEGPSPLEWFLAELDRRVTDQASKRAVVAILRSMAGQRLYLTRRELTRPDLDRQADGLLHAGFTSTQARRELVARVGCSKRTADRLVGAAIRRLGNEGGRRDG